MVNPGWEAEDESLCALGTAGPLERPPSFSWAGDGGLAALGSLDGTHFASYLPDVNDALNHVDAHIVIECIGVVLGSQAINTSEFFVRGDVLFAEHQGELVRMERNEEGSFACDRNSPQNQFINGEVSSTHPDVSDDGAWVTFQGSDAIYVAPGDGSLAPWRISPDDEIEHMRPHFALGGRQVVWTSREYPGDGSSMVRVHRVNRDGSGHLVVFAQAISAQGDMLATMGSYY
jgi:hypothetical protein